MPPYGACLLGSINLARLIERPFEPDAALDEAQLAALVPVAVRMLDNAIDCSNFRCRSRSARRRRSGASASASPGLADALVCCNVRYGTPAAAVLTGRWLKLIRDAAYRASIDLATEKGAFPLFERDAYLAAPMIQELEPELREAIARHGIRNALLTSIAPTGTISLLADNVSSGIEPIFALAFTRAILMPDGARRQESVSDHAYRLFRRLKGDDAPLPDSFVTAMELPPEAHLIMQAAAQRHIDSAISKTINVPADAPFEQFKCDLPARLRTGLQGLYDLPTQRCHGQHSIGGYAGWAGDLPLLRYRRPGRERGLRRVPALRLFALRLTTPQASTGSSMASVSMRSGARRGWAEGRAKRKPCRWSQASPAGCGVACRFRRPRP